MCPFGNRVGVPGTQSLVGIPPSSVETNALFKQESQFCLLYNKQDSCTSISTGALWTTSGVRCMKYASCLVK